MKHLTDQELAAQQPKDIDEAVHCMRTTLTQFHEQADKRAIFLRVYYIMTLEVQAAIQGRGVYAGRRVFCDPEWVSRLSGKFSTLYFRSLATFERETDPPVERAWKETYKTAKDERSSVVQNALQGINAHINYDLPKALALNLDPAELNNNRIMQMRKFDHDQVNNLLVRTLGYIQDVLRNDYEPGIGLADRLLGSIDEKLGEVGLKYYRERVWGDGMAFAAAMATDHESVDREEATGEEVTGEEIAEEIVREEIVRQKLDWESDKIAGYINSKRWLWRLERGLGFLSFWRKAKPWNQITLDEPGGVKTGMPINVMG